MMLCNSQHPFTWISQYIYNSPLGFYQPIIQIRKLRPREVRELAQDCTADEWQARLKSRLFLSTPCNLPSVQGCFIHSHIKESYFFYPSYLNA